MSGPDAWAIYNDLWDKDPQTLTSDQRLLVAFAGVRQEVNSGGFDSYFRYSWGAEAPTAVRAAQEVGCQPLADLIQEGIARLGEGPYMVDAEARSDRLDLLDVDFDDLDERYFQFENDVNMESLMELIASRLP